MTGDLGQLRIWIGLVEVKPRPASTTLNSTALGAVTNVVTWARNETEFTHKAEVLMDSLDLEVTGVEDAEPVEERLGSGFDLDDELRLIVDETRTNDGAIRFSTFHTWSEE